MDYGSRTLFVGNLGPGVTEPILRELFLQAGPIEQVRLPMYNGVHKSFAHIIYRYESSVNYARDVFQGTMLCKQELLLQQSNTQRDFDQGRFPPHQANNHRDRDMDRNRHDMKQVSTRGSHYRDGRNDDYSRGNSFRDGRNDGHHRGNFYRDGRHEDHRHGNSYRGERDEFQSRSNNYRDRRSENHPRSSRDNHHRDDYERPSTWGMK